MPSATTDRLPAPAAVEFLFFQTLPPTIRRRYNRRYPFDELYAAISFARGRSMPAPVVPLSELAEGQEADFYALLSEKQELTTRDGKPYFRVSFRDARREVGLPVWADSPLANACRNEWSVGEFYKLRAKVQQTNFGPQLEIRKIRPVESADASDGFDPLMCLPVSRFDPEQMFAELEAIAKEQIQDEPLRQLVVELLEENREELLVLPAAKHHHPAFASGFLEHVVNVARTGGP